MAVTVSQHTVELVTILTHKHTSEYENDYCVPISDATLEFLDSAPQVSPQAAHETPCNPMTSGPTHSDNE